MYVKADQMYPSPKEMEELGTSLGLTAKEVRGWFKRRRSRSKGGKSLPNDGVGEKNPQSYSRSCMRSSTSSRCNFGAAVEKRCSVGTRKASRQVLLTSQHILAKIFRKDGPLLGSEFDHLPSGAHKGIFASLASLQDNAYMSLGFLEIDCKHQSFILCQRNLCFHISFDFYNKSILDWIIGLRMSIGLICA